MKHLKSLFFSLCLFMLLDTSLVYADPVMLKVFELPDPRKSDAYTKANIAVIEAFKEKYPNIELHSFSGIKIEGMDLDSGPLMAIAGGVAPDILYVNFQIGRASCRERV